MNLSVFPPQLCVNSWADFFCSFGLATSLKKKRKTLNSNERYFKKKTDLLSHLTRGGGAG